MRGLNRCRRVSFMCVKSLDTRPLARVLEGRQILEGRFMRGLNRYRRVSFM